MCVLFNALCYAADAVITFAHLHLHYSLTTLPHPHPHPHHTLTLTHSSHPQRLAKLRAFYHRWWNRVALLINLEVSTVHNWHRIMRKVQR